MKKRILAALVASAAVLSLAGCNNGGSSSGSSSSSSSSSDKGSSSSSTKVEESKPAEDVKNDDDTLTILTWESNSDIQVQKKFFCQKTGIAEDKINIVTVGSDGTAGRDGIKQYMLGSEDADLFTMDAEWTSLFTNDDSLTMPYSEIGLKAADFPNAYKYTIEMGTAENGIFKAASFQCTPGGFVYRSDLAKKYLDVNSPEEMQAKVKDWDTFKSTAETLYSASGNKTSICATTGGLWQVYQCYRTQPWVKDGKFVMDTAEQFYDIAKGYVDNKLCANVPQWEAAWYAAVQDGTALGDFVPTWGLTTAGGGSILENFAGIQKDADGNVTGYTLGDDKLAICEGPSGWYWGGTYYAVSARCNTKATAKKWIELFCNDDAAMKEYATQTGDFVNNKPVMQSIIDAKTNQNKLMGGQDHFAVLSNVADKIDVTGKVTKYDSQAKTCLNDSVSALLKGEVADKAAAIEKCKDDFAKACPDVKVD